MSTALAPLGDSRDGMSSVQAATLPAAELSGARKAAVLLMSLGTERSAPILRRLSEPEVAEILSEVAAMEDVDGELIDAVMAEFAISANSYREGTTGGAEMARRMLSASVDGERARFIGGLLPAESRPPAFIYLHHVEPSVASAILAEEPPQAIALALVHISPDLAAKLLLGLPEELQREVAIRIATLETTTPEVLEIVEDQLARRFSAIGADDHTSVGGVDSLVALLSRTDETIERSIVDHVNELDPVLGDRLRAAMFSFEDLVTLDDRAIQQVLRGVDSKDLATALKGASAEVKEKLLRNLSSRAAETLREEIELLGRVRSAVVQEARARVLTVVREMEAAGTIQLERAGSDDYVD